MKEGILDYVGITIRIPVHGRGSFVYVRYSDMPIEIAQKFARFQRGATQPSPHWEKYCDCAYVHDFIRFSNGNLENNGVKVAKYTKYLGRT